MLGSWFGNWDWPAVIIIAAAAAIQQWVTHKRWQALIKAIREKRRNGKNGDGR